MSRAIFHVIALNRLSVNVQLSCANVNNYKMSSHVHAVSAVTLVDVRDGFNVVISPRYDRPRVRRKMPSYGLHARFGLYSPKRMVSPINRGVCL